MKQYVDTGKIRYAVLDDPLPMHPLAPKAAIASHCAMDQGRFWEMHHQLMSKQDALDNLISIASSVGLDIPQFEECLKANKYSEQIAAGSSLAGKFGIAGVPAFILAKSDPQNPTKLKGISSIIGAQPFANFQREIDQAQSIISQQSQQKEAFK